MDAASIANSLLPVHSRWENLTLADDFMFGKVFQDESLCLELVRLILPHLNIERIVMHELQMPLHHTADTRGVRFDVYLRDDKGRIIIVEMQVVNRVYLFRRVRAYHSITDLDAMDRSTVGRYDDMPEVIVIFICNFDPFNLGRHIYTFKNICMEERDLVMDDGATTIFLNTKGKDNAVSPRLKAFLKLVEGQSSDDDFVKRLEERLAYAKQDRFLRQEYLLTKFDRNERREEGRQEGLKEGRKEGLNEGRQEGRKEGQANIVNHMRSTGMTDEQISAVTGLSLEALRSL